MAPRLFLPADESLARICDTALRSRVSSRARLFAMFAEKLWTFSWERGFPPRECYYRSRSSLNGAWIDERDPSVKSTRDLRRHAQENCDSATFLRFLLGRSRLSIRALSLTNPMDISRDCQRFLLEARRTRGPMRNGDVAG